MSTTTVPATAAAVDTEPTNPVPPERLAILLALGVRDGLPVWQSHQLITERPGPDDPPLLSITFPTHQAADAWAALMTEPYRTVHSDGHVSIHAGWHGWRVVVSGVGQAPPLLDEETLALAARLDDGQPGGTAETDVPVVNPNWPVDARTAREAMPPEARWSNTRCTTCGYYPPCQCPGFPFGTGTGIAEAVTR